MEFALALPVLMLLLFGGAQLILYVDASRKVDLIANSISQMVSRAMPPQGSTIAKIDANDVHFSYDAAAVLFPYAVKDAQRRGLPWWQNVVISYASIAFKPKVSPCPDSADMSACYTAEVVWTSSGISAPSGPNFRPCGTPQQPADDSAPPSRTTLPRSVYGSASLVVIDVVFNFVPTFGKGLVPPARIARTAYVQPRYASLVRYDASIPDMIATACPGY